MPVQYSYTSTPLSACTVELYLYSPYGPYSLYRASVPVQGCTFTFTFTVLFIRYTSINCRISSLHSFIFKICVNKQVYNKIMTTKMVSQTMRMSESSCDVTHKRNLTVTALAVVQTRAHDSQGSVVFIGI